MLQNPQSGYRYHFLKRSLFVRLRLLYLYLCHGVGLFGERFCGPGALCPASGRFGLPLHRVYEFVGEAGPKEGAEIEDISAGLSISVVKNALYKVIRATSAESLGRHIIVQGGTFLNDAILRAFEQEVGIEVIRPNIAGLMGAYGAALYARSLGLAQSQILDVEGLAHFSHETTERVCQLCGNHCKLTVNRFNNNRELIAGNRCERPIKSQEKNFINITYNAYRYKRDQILKRKSVKGKRGRIGLPMGLNIYENYHFWHPILTNLGYEVVRAPFGSRDLFLEGQATIPSDTVCYPAKMMHGSVTHLIQKQGCRRFFIPACPIILMSISAATIIIARWWPIIRRCCRPICRCCRKCAL